MQIAAEVLNVDNNTQLKPIIEVLESPYKDPAMNSSFGSQGKANLNSGRESDFDYD